MVNVKIDFFCIHHGSFHCLKADRLLNDEVSVAIFYLCELCIFCEDCKWIFEVTCQYSREMFCYNITSHDKHNQSLSHNKIPSFVKGEFVLHFTLSYDFCYCD